MSVAGKAATAFMLESGALSYFGFSEMLNMGKAGLDAFGSGVENAWNKDEDKFRKGGESAGEVIGGVGMVAANMQMLFQEQSTHGRWFDGKPTSVTEAKSLNGKLYQQLDGDAGGYRRARIMNGKLGFGKPITDDTLLKTLGGKTAKEGVIRTASGSSKFMQNHGFIKGIAPFAIAMGVGWAAKSVFGFAGGIIDEAMKDEHRFRNIHYDSRFFNTQQDTMTNYQQLGSAMNNYQNRMQSTARIFHSR